MSEPEIPAFLGAPVHYVAYGTPKGEYKQLCRIATVTEVGQWCTVETIPGPEENDRRTLLQRWFDDAVALFVMNPQGVFFNGAGPVACRHATPAPKMRGGTWHHPMECPDARG